MEKATFDDLIARKLQRENAKPAYKEISVDSLGKTLVFKKPSDDVLLDMMDDMMNDVTSRKAVESYQKLIYLSCEMLQDSELHKELGIKDPFEVVSVLFDFTEILTIGDELIDFVGLGDLGEKIKNS